MLRNQKHSYQCEWFIKYPWLDYDVTSDSVTCHICKHQNSLGNLKAERSKENTFLDKGLDYWKRPFKDSIKIKEVITRNIEKALPTNSRNLVKINYQLFQPKISTLWPLFTIIKHSLTI